MGNCLARVQAEVSNKEGKTSAHAAVKAKNKDRDVEKAPSSFTVSCFLIGVCCAARTFAVSSIRPWSKSRPAAFWLAYSKNGLQYMCKKPGAMQSNMGIRKQGFQSSERTVCCRLCCFLFAPDKAALAVCRAPASVLGPD